MELLIAVAVFAILGVMAYGGLNSVLATQSHTEQETARLRALQLSVRYLERDIGQFVDRPVRNQFGDQEPALLTGDELKLSLTHAGRPNPAGLTRSQLQRVAYELRDDTLIRLTWPLLDGAETESALETKLLEDVQEIEIRVLDTQGKWRESWPPLSEGSSVTSSPAAVEITFDVEPWGSIRRMIVLPR